MNPLIQNFISSKRIAVVGMSRSGKKFGNMASLELKSKGYEKFKRQSRWCLDFDSSQKCSSGTRRSCADWPEKYLVTTRRVVGRSSGNHRSASIAGCFKKVHHDVCPAGQVCSQISPNDCRYFW
jgi:hypothetical protein